MDASWLIIARAVSGPLCIIGKIWQQKPYTWDDRAEVYLSHTVWWLLPLVGSMRLVHSLTYAQVGLN